MKSGRFSLPFLMVIVGNRFVSLVIYLHCLQHNLFLVFWVVFLWSQDNKFGFSMMVLIAVEEHLYQIFPRKFLERN